MIDDIHWAEPAFLDLLENLLETVENASVLLVATSRHDLLEARPQWGERERSRRLVLKPLTDEAATQVVGNLLGAAGLPETLIKRIVAAAEGNPLYVEQMLSMLIDSGAVSEDGSKTALTGDADIVVPPTIHALLEARLDKLERTERAAAEPAAVIGMEFPHSAVQSLAPQQIREKVGDQLQALARKHFIRPSASDGADARYRFDHHLVRDTVYNGLLKRARATMHVEFVKWADQVNAESDRGQEFEAILGYHLEQAYRYLGELGPIDEAGAAIGRDAARRLAAAARRSLARGDTHAARNLYARAIGLLPTGDPHRSTLLPTYAEVLMELGEYGEARTVLSEASSVAESPRVKVAAELIGMLIRLSSGDRGNWSEDARDLAERAVATLNLEEAHDELATAYRVLALAHQHGGRLEEAATAIEQLISHARRAGNERLVARSALGMALSALLGPTPVPQAIAQCESALAGGLGDRQVSSVIQCKLARLRAMNGESETARTQYHSARALLRELGQGVQAASTGIDVAIVELLAGDPSAAERELRPDYAFLEARGEAYFLSTMASLLARAVSQQGRDEEALALSEIAEVSAAKHDTGAQVLWRAVRARILARAGQTSEAEVLAQAACEAARKSGMPILKADTLVDLAAVSLLIGKTELAQEALAEACATYESKGDVSSLAYASKWRSENFKH
jgi:tetratricopeptide (TPR) repeat protein